MTNKQTPPMLQLVPRDRDLSVWKTKWLHEETSVRCSECLASQPYTEAKRPFRHVKGCPRATEFSQFPWMDLTSILKDEVTQDRGNNGIDRKD